MRRQVAARIRGSCAFAPPLLFLSTGELWPAEKMAESGRLLKAGQEVRIANCGGCGDHEVDAGIRQVIGFVEEHASSRFESAWEAGPDKRVQNRVGFREREAVNKEEGRWRYYVLPAMWRRGVAKGFDGAALVKAIVERGLIIPGNDGKPTMQKKIPNHGNEGVPPGA